MSFAPIAIVGRACVLPGAHTPEALWSLVSEQRSAITEAPRMRFRVDARDVLGAPGAAVDRTVSTRGGYVEGYTLDAAGLRVSHADLAPLDPLVHWLCTTGRDALADARIDTSQLRTGAVFGNLSFPTEAMTAWGERETLAGLMGFPKDTLPRPFDRDVDVRNRFMSGLPARVMTRALGLQAGAFALDAACASSLYALDLAARALHARRADVMLAGAVNRADALFLHVGFTALSALSPSGQSRPFDRRADGLLPAEGCVLVALMRLEDALAQKRRVYGVLRGVGLSNDGRSRNLLAPASDGQARALKNAWGQASIDPRWLDYVECHATGTPMGDKAELTTLAEAMPKRDTPLALSSLKGNLGHLITAAGAAGLLKVLSALEHEALPPSLGCDEPIEALAGDGAFHVVRAPAPWRAHADRPRMAGISAFGFGGNNAHAVIEEHGKAAPVAVPVRARQRPPVDTLAVVAIGVRAGVAREVADIVSAIADGARLADTDRLDVAIEGLRFPPNDLKESIAQQLLFFEAARDAMRAIPTDALTRERTGVVVGMGTDVKVTTPGVRWRALALSRGLAGDAPGALKDLVASETRDAAMPPLGASGVLGCMPNVVANRVSVQLDLRGPGFAVSAEEDSGSVALEVARTLFESGALDACLVGAVDACRDPRMRAALEQLRGAPVDPGDAGLCLVVMPHALALERSLPVLATLGPPAAESTTHAFDRAASARMFGDVHAATSLAAIVGACAATASATTPASAPWPSAHRAITTEQLRVESAGAPTVSGARVHVCSLSAPSRAALIAALRAELTPSTHPHQPWRAFVHADSDAALRARADKLAQRLEHEPRVAGPGMWAGERTLDARDVCLLFGTAAQPTAWPSRALLAAFPDAGFALGSALGEERVRALLSFDEEPPGPLGDLLVSSAQMQIHAGFVRDVLGVAAGHALGVSLGESNALFAMGAWNDLFGMLDRMKAGGLFSRLTGGELLAARAWWRAHGEPALATGAPWKAVVARAAGRPLAREAAARLDEPAFKDRVWLLVIHTSDEVELGGAPDAVDALVRALGCSAAVVPHMPAVHCPLLGPVAEAYRAMHHQKVTPIGAQVWSHGPMRALPLDAAHADDLVADAITAQASRTVDVPALLARAVAGGVKAFVDLSPRGLVGAWARRTLGDEAKVWSIDGGATPTASLEGALDVCGALFTHGLDVRTEPLVRFARRTTTAGPHLEVPMHALPRRAALPVGDARSPEAMPPPPPLPRVLPEPPAPRATPTATVSERPAAHATSGAPPTHAPSAPPVAAPAPDRAHAQQAEAPFADTLAGALLDVHAAHADYLALAGALHTQFLAQEEHVARGLAGAAGPDTSIVSEVKQVDADAATGALWTRADLERLASGAISSVWGEAFARQDGFRRQVRMPEPPLLLADRVMAIDAKPGVLEKNRSIQTETDVRWDAWYLHEGRCPAGVLIETGQADLLLVSYMGVDFENRGERVYRLLGCDLTYRAPLPLAGTTLAHDIHVDGFANHGDTRIFFFHSDTTDKQTGELLLSVRGGQAGFFSDEELLRSGGVLWRPEDEDPRALAAQPLAPPPQPTMKRTLSRDDIAAFAAGDAVRCFGETHARAASHVRTPRIAAARLQLVDRVTHLDFQGGPWKRGYLRAELDLSPDSWFFAGHFKDDPCMPGTLMFEGCLSTLALYLAAGGWTLERDGCLFEPAVDKTFKLRCRGQAIPSSRHMVYEVFIKSIVDAPEGETMARVVADILVTVDGLKSLHCADTELVLRRDWPLSSRPDLLGAATKPSGADAVGGVGSTEPCAFDQRSLLATGIGRPSEAFPGLYNGADTRKRIPRLPGPPYHFMSRVLSVDGPPMGSLLRGESPVGTSALVAYDVPPDAWFFDSTAQSSGATMPFSVLLEVALQPCGWVSSYVGSALTTDEDLCYRNLDGKATLHREVPRDVGTLLARATLTKSSSSSGMIIQELSFAVTLADGTPVYDGTTVFGFFPLAAFERQAGTGSTEAERARLRVSAHPAPLAASAPVGGTGLRLPAAPLLMIDRVADLAPDHARIRTEKDVDVAEWFFKAHFYEDPVQPGSLGLEAMVQALQQLAMRTRADEGMKAPRFEALATGLSHSWKYRGQVVPRNRQIDVEVELVSRTRDARGVVLSARGHLWVDGLKIYTCDGLAVRVVDDG